LPNSRADADHVISLMEQDASPKDAFDMAGHLRMSQHACRKVMVTKSSFRASRSKTRCNQREAAAPRLYGASRRSAPPDLHAGDEVAVLTEASAASLLVWDASMATFCGRWPKRSRLQPKNNDSLVLWVALRPSKHSHAGRCRKTGEREILSENSAEECIPNAEDRPSWK